MIERQMGDPLIKIIGNNINKIKIMLREGEFRYNKCAWIKWK